jgi:hypothetical protein
MGESPKIEARLDDPVMQRALANYMRAKHIKNRSVILVSALGQMLEREGFLTANDRLQEEAQAAEAPAQEKPPAAKRVRYSKSRKKK